MLKTCFEICRNWQRMGASVKLWLSLFCLFWDRKLRAQPPTFTVWFSVNHFPRMVSPLILMTVGLVPTVTPCYAVYIVSDCLRRTSMARLWWTGMFTIVFTLLLIKLCLARREAQEFNGTLLLSPCVMEQLCISRWEMSSRWACRWC